MKDQRISIQANNSDVTDILQALESKTGIKIVIYDGVVTNNISLDIKDIAIHSLNILLQKMSLNNTAIVYDKQIAGLWLIKSKPVQYLIRESLHKAHAPLHVEYVFDDLSRIPTNDDHLYRDPEIPLASLQEMLSTHPYFCQFFLCHAIASFIYPAHQKASKNIKS